MVLSFSRHYRVWCTDCGSAGAKGPPGKRLSVPTQTTWCRALREFCQLVENKNVGTAVAGFALKLPLRRCPRIIAIQRRTDPCVFGKSPKETNASIRDKAGMFSVVSAFSSKLRRALDTNTAVRHPPRRLREPCRGLLHAELPDTARVMGLSRRAKY